MLSEVTSSWGQALRKRVHDSCKWPLNLPSHLVLQANWGTYLDLVMIQRASMSLTMALSFCSVIRSSGSLCEEIRQLWRYCRKAEQHWSIYRKCGFLWPGYLTLLQICCATSGRSLYSPECFFSLLIIPVILPGGNCIEPSVVQHQVLQAAGVSQHIHHTNNHRKESTHQKCFLTF